jgi:hypothetical protein
MSDVVAAPRKGPHAVFRGKVRAPVSILLTPQGHELLAATVRQSGMSRSDVVEYLLRRYGAEVPVGKSHEA